MAIVLLAWNQLLRFFSLEKLESNQKKGWPTSFGMTQTRDFRELFTWHCPYMASCLLFILVQSIRECVAKLLPGSVYYALVVNDLGLSFIQSQWFIWSTYIGRRGGDFSQFLKPQICCNLDYGLNENNTIAWIWDIFVGVVLKIELVDKSFFIFIFIYSKFPTRRDTPKK